MLTLLPVLLALALGAPTPRDAAIDWVQDTSGASGPTTPVPASTQDTDAVLVHARELLEEARGARAAKDFDTAREKTLEAIEGLLEVGDGAGDGLADVLEDLGTLAYECGELRAAEQAQSRVLQVASRTLPDDHADLQRLRCNLAITNFSLGDLQGARAQFEQVLETFSRTLPDDHPHVLMVRQNLAVTIKMLGDLPGARALEEQVLEGFSRSLADDHPDLQKARLNLGYTLYSLGYLHGAQVLQEQVLGVLSRTLSDDDPDLQRARGNLSITVFSLGDLPRAQALQEQVLEVFSRTLPDDHPELQAARLNLAVTIKALGDLPGARALEEQALQVLSRTLPSDHPDLQTTRSDLAITIKVLGDLQGARALEEQVLEVRSRTLPDDHPDLQKARLNLAGTLKMLGDLMNARALQEQVVEVRSRTLPDDHPDLQAARLSLAATIYALGDLTGARALEEQVLAVRSRTLPADHPHLQAALHSLAVTIYSLGDFPTARALFEQVLVARSRTLPDSHPDLQVARGNLAMAIARTAVASPARSEENGERDREPRLAKELCAELLLARCRGQTSAAREALLESSAREAQARCERLADGLDLSLSFAAGIGGFGPMPELETASFVLSEVTRGAALGSAALMRRATNTPMYAERRESLRGQSDDLAILAQKGTTSEEFQAALANRDGTQRELAKLACELSGGSPAGLGFDPEALASQLDAHEVIVALRRYTRWSLAEEADHSVESLCALVLRRSDAAEVSASSLTRVELGTIEAIDAAVAAWRTAVGTGDGRGIGVVASSAPLEEPAREEHARGEALRRMVLDPFLPAISGAKRVVFALDDVLHLVPIEALPLEKGPDGRFDLVGDRWQIETRCTLAELLAPSPKPNERGALLALGGAAYDSEPLALDEGEAEPEALGSIQVASTLRGGAWERGFAPLAYTGLEAREIAALYCEVFGEDSGALVLEKRGASRAALEELAPKARWLHVATHGWFASESIRSWKDPAPLDRYSGLGMRLSGEEQIKGMSPMLLCGLALAGANLPENAVGRAPGLITAEELAALDLSGCELAVLSACDTNVGERRAGQGVASLQMALQMAGARSVITSLWKVPDEATKELMLDFYRRMWVEKKPKRQALWEAKMTLRNAKDERGEPRYTTRDWAAWVLTGEPD